MDHGRTNINLNLTQESNTIVIHCAFRLSELSRLKVIKKLSKSLKNKRIKVTFEFENL